jgi:hypothetical protein
MIVRPLRPFFPLLALAALVLIPGTSSAGSSDPDVLRLEKAGHSLSWNATIAGHDGRYGHAEALVKAPLAKVRETVTDYTKFKDLAPANWVGPPRLRARVIGKEAASTDLYMQEPIMHGAMSLWQVMRFGVVKEIAPGVQTVEGTMQKGNVKAANIILTMKQINEDWTVLKCDLQIIPSFPAPQSAVDEEMRDSAKYAIDALHDRAQGVPATFALNDVTPQ